MSFITTFHYFSVENPVEKVVKSEVEVDSLLFLHAPLLTQSYGGTTRDVDFSRWKDLEESYLRQIKYSVKEIVHERKQDDLGARKQLYMLLVTYRKIFSKMAESYQKIFVNSRNSDQIFPYEKHLVDTAHNLDFLNDEPCRSVLCLGVDTTFNPFLLARRIDDLTPPHQESLGDATTSLKKEISASPSEAHIFQNLSKVVHDAALRVAQRFEKSKNDDLKKWQDLKWQEGKDRQLREAVEKGLQESRMIGQRMIKQERHDGKNENQILSWTRGPRPGPMTHNATETFIPSTSPQIHPIVVDAFDFSPSPYKRTRVNAFSPTKTRIFPFIEKPKPFLSPKKEERRFIAHFHIDKKADYPTIKASTAKEKNIIVDPGMTKRLFWLRWKKCHYNSTKLSEFWKGLMYRNKRTVLDLLQKYAWQSFHLRRMQYKYYLGLIDTTFRAWKSHRRWCQRFKMLHLRVIKRKAKKFLVAWYLLSKTYFENRNFKEKYLKKKHESSCFESIKQFTILQRHFTKQRLKHQTMATFCDKVTRKQCFDRWASRCRFVWRLDQLDELIEKYLLKRTLIRWCLVIKQDTLESG